MSLPELTHAHSLILASAQNDISGREIRSRLADEGMAMSAPAFYQMMGRLERDGLVDGWYRNKTVRGYKCKESVYRTTAAGCRALHNAQHFYQHTIGRLCPAS